MRLGILGLGCLATRAAATCTTLGDRLESPALDKWEVSLFEKGVLYKSPDEGAKVCLNLGSWFGDLARQGCEGTEDQQDCRKAKMVVLGQIHVMVGDKKIENPLGNEEVFECSHEDTRKMCKDMRGISLNLSMRVARALFRAGQAPDLWQMGDISRNELGDELTYIRMGSFVMIAQSDLMMQVTDDVGFASRLLTEPAVNESLRDFALNKLIEPGKEDCSRIPKGARFVEAENGNHRIVCGKNGSVYFQGKPEVTEDKTLAVCQYCAKVNDIHDKMALEGGGRARSFRRYVYGTGNSISATLGDPSKWFSSEKSTKKMPNRI